MVEWQRAVTHRPKIGSAYSVMCTMLIVWRNVLQFRSRRSLATTIECQSANSILLKSKLAALAARIGAKLRRAVQGVRYHAREYHRSRANGATGRRHGFQPLFRRHRSPATRNGK
jgi:hypothetical protein